jgi:hypothetical protein
MPILIMNKDKLDKQFKNQSELFDYIWEIKEHKSEISGDNLLPKGHFQWHWQFLHILPKGTYPKYKLLPKNIILGTVKEHENQDHIDLFQEKKEQLRREYYEEYYDKKF